jgi:hypothetical protein
MLPFDDGCAQFVFEQDIVQGGITAAGFSTGQGSGSGNFDIYIEPGSTIKKAYVFSYTQRNPPPAFFTLNDLNFAFDTIGVIMNVSYYSPPWPSASPSRLYYKEITNEINPEATNYNVTIPFQPNLPINAGFWTLFLIVVYEHPDLSPAAYSIFINDQDLIGNESYEVNGSNPINSEIPVGFSLYTDRSGSGFSADKEVYFNSNLLGIVGGSDNVNWQWNFGGVKGHFYYQNNQLFGLDDDVANNTMSGTDGLADVSNYLQNNTTQYGFRLKHINYPNQQPNHTHINLAYTLAYTTPCLPFETTLTEEVTLCRGDPAQLLATGGTSTGPAPAYEWLPEEGLSCYNCPNPVFEGDSSKVYTVRIWNTDSCSKVLPVKVNVLDAPHSANLSTNPATCGGAGGELIIGSISGGQSAYQYSLGNAWTGNPTANIFSNLPAGDYTFFVRDQNLCMYTQDFTIEEINTAQAAFTANPQSGTEPLAVQFNNQSSGATDYQWSAGDSISNNFNFNYTFDTAGSYPVQLISWYNEPQCADTAYATIVVNPDYTHALRQFRNGLYHSNHPRGAYQL